MTIVTHDAETRFVVDVLRECGFPYAYAYRVTDGSIQIEAASIDYDDYGLWKAMSLCGRTQLCWPCWEMNAKAPPDTGPVVEPPCGHPVLGSDWERMT